MCIWTHTSPDLCGDFTHNHLESKLLRMTAEQPCTSSASSTAKPRGWRIWRRGRSKAAGPSQDAPVIELEPDIERIDGTGAGELIEAAPRRQRTQPKTNALQNTRAPNTKHHARTQSNATTPTTRASRTHYNHHAPPPSREHRIQRWAA